MNGALNQFICFIDLLAAFVIVALMLETTRHASISGFIRGDGQSRWAFFRRIVYTAVAIALFAKSMYILDGQIRMQTPDAVIWLVVVMALLIFPALRAAGVVDQDRWVGFRDLGKHLHR